MRIPIIGTEIDERFFHHRQRSTSLAGIAGACMAGGLFFYHYFAHGVISWDLFAVIATIAIVKLGLMAWYFKTE
jgi:ABC-type thiamin/hydroxymethylpyrimidine transport system permease subunit